ncbi:unnamed protein product [Lymnaea stagnalis]|uniref:Decapping nuclease n=1 Tax=Lymnaea stagnalis TaxID=6523 RepID=A0AAV2HV69_LYMST
MKRKYEGNEARRTEEKRQCTASESVLNTWPRLYDKAFPHFKEPAEIGFFSYDEKRQYQRDRSQLRVFAPPDDRNTCNFDLRKGYSKMIKKDETVQTHLDGILHWIMKNKELLLVTPNKNLDKTEITKKELFHRHKYDFVCWRGLLTRLLCVPYENQEDLLVAVIYFRGTYYMCEFDTETKKKQKEKTTPKQEEMCAWGFKFEQYVTADKTGAVPNAELPVNTNAEFGSIVCSRLANHSLMFGAEVDCEDVNCKNGNNYVELKTSRIIESQRQYENFCRFKLLKWWAQSYVLGIPSIVCGFRDDNGVVKKLEDYSVSKIPRLVQAALKNPWRPTVCFNFLNEFLQFVKTNVTETSDRCVYVFKWQPGSPVTYQRHSKDTEFHFLPEWFFNWDAWDTVHESTERL